MKTLNPAQVENALVYLQEQWPAEPMSLEVVDDYGLVLAHLFPGELILALERLPQDHRPSPMDILEAAREHRPVKKPPTKTLIRSIIRQARQDLERAG